MSSTIPPSDSEFSGPTGSIHGRQYPLKLVFAILLALCCSACAGVNVPTLPLSLQPGLSDHYSYEVESRIEFGFHDHSKKQKKVVPMKLRYLLEMTVASVSRDSVKFIAKIGKAQMWGVKDHNKQPSLIDTTVVMDQLTDIRRLIVTKSNGELIRTELLDTLKPAGDAAARSQTERFNDQIESLCATFFVPLPERKVAVGDVWRNTMTDSVGNELMTFGVNIETEHRFEQIADTIDHRAARIQTEFMKLNLEAAEVLVKFFAMMAGGAEPLIDSDSEGSGISYIDMQTGMIVASHSSTRINSSITIPIPDKPQIIDLSIASDTEVRLMPR